MFKGAMLFPSAAVTDIQNLSLAFRDRAQKPFVGFRRKPLLDVGEGDFMNDDLLVSDTSSAIYTPDARGPEHRNHFGGEAAG
jgi:hypothetical protein